MVNFYRRLLPGIARTLQPLTDALKGAPKMLEWPPAAAAAFGAAKAALAAAVSLAHPAPNAVLSLATDAAGTLCSKFAAALCSITLSVRSLLASIVPTIVGDGKANRRRSTKSATPSR